MARRYSSSAADAEDAYQRALEKLFSVSPETDTEDLLLSWLLTVVRNEALMIGRSQSRLVAVPYDELAESWSDDGATPEDRAIDRQELVEGREALLRINPEQARCLLLRAEGLTYDEIAEATGFSYAKVHRALTEGRRMYRGLLGRIESGAECRRVAPLISLLVDQEIGDSDRADVELHLKNCVNCRATRREFALAPQQLASAFPVAAALSNSGGLLQQAFDHVHSAAVWINERVFSHVSMGPAAEMTVAKKLVLVSAVSASVVAGGATVEQFAGSDRRPSVRSFPSSRRLRRRTPALQMSPARSTGPTARSATNRWSATPHEPPPKAMSLKPRPTCLANERRPLLLVAKRSGNSNRNRSLSSPTTTSTNRRSPSSDVRGCSRYPTPP